MQQMNQIAQQNAAASEKMTSNAEELANKAISLKESIPFLKV